MFVNSGRVGMSDRNFGYRSKYEPLRESGKPEDIKGVRTVVSVSPNPALEQVNTLIELFGYDSTEQRLKEYRHEQGIDALEYNPYNCLPRLDRAVTPGREAETTSRKEGPPSEEGNPGQPKSKEPEGVNEEVSEGRGRNLRRHRGRQRERDPGTEIRQDLELTRKNRKGTGGRNKGPFVRLETPRSAGNEGGEEIKGGT